MEPRNSPVSVDLALGADVGAVLDPGHVTGVGGGVVAPGPDLGVERREGSGVDHQLAQAVVLLLGAVAPFDLVGSAQGGHLVNPVDQLLVRAGTCHATPSACW
jgi:hypothetical protein